MIPPVHAKSVRPLGYFWQVLLETISVTPERMGIREEAPFLLAIFASFAVGITASWQRWGNPLVDSGRELNVPLRLFRGEMLYSDVSYLYGPFSPYLNAVLYRIFHPALWTIWGRGIAATLVILALAYWLARQVFGRFPAFLACVAVTWICALKPQGNYMLAYSFGGLDGCLFVLAATAASILWLKLAHRRWALVGGMSAALAVLSKTELGLAAFCVGVLAALLVGYPRMRSIGYGLVAFLLPAMGIPVLVFAWLAARVGWKTLEADNHLFFGHVPWQLVYFNQVRFGFDRPWYSVGLMVVSLIRLISVGGLVASVAILIGRRRDHIGGQTEIAGPRRGLLLLALSFAGLALTTFGVLDLGPLMPMPILLTVLGTAAVVAFARAIQRDSPRERIQTGVAIILIISALACLPRILLRVSTGGALSSFLLPISIVLFVYVWLEIFPKLIPDPKVRAIAKQLISAVLVAGLLATAGTLFARYRRKFNYPLVTSQGTWRVSPEHGVAFQKALQFIEEHTTIDDTVAVLPEGTSLNFFSGRRNPLREEITTPGFLDVAGEEQAIERLRKTHTPVILLTNRLTPEFAQDAFGRDYDQRLFSWIEHNYRSCGVFGTDPDPRLTLGSSVFFIRAYCLRSAT